MDYLSCTELVQRNVRLRTENSRFQRVPLRLMHRSAPWKWPSFLISRRKLVLLAYVTKTYAPCPVLDVSGATCPSLPCGILRSKQPVSRGEFKVLPLPVSDNDAVSNPGAAPLSSRAPLHFKFAKWQLTFLPSHKASVIVSKTAFTTPSASLRVNSFGFQADLSTHFGAERSPSLNPVASKKDLKGSEYIKLETS